MLCPTFNSRFAPEAEIVLLHKQTMSLSQKIVLYWALSHHHLGFSQLGN